MVYETAHGKIRATPVKGERALLDLKEELTAFLKTFPIDMQSFNRSPYLVLGRFIDGRMKDQIAFVFIKNGKSVIHFFAENGLNTNLSLYEFALRIWKQNFTIQ